MNLCGDSLGTLVALGPPQWDDLEAEVARTRFAGAVAHLPESESLAKELFDVYTMLQHRKAVELKAWTYQGNRVLDAEMAWTNRVVLIVNGWRPGIVTGRKDKDLEQASGVIRYISRVMPHVMTDWIYSYGHSTAWSRPPEACPPHPEFKLL